MTIGNQRVTPDGLVLVDKQAGLTSHDIVAIFRRASKIRKVGHTGTLDPIATGLLILCTGRATRIQSYLMNLEKVYEGEIQFGWATDTYDSAGSALSEQLPANVEGIDFQSHLLAFIGEIDQMPPPYSAKKIEGVRAYEIARRGEQPNLTPKRVKIGEAVIFGVSGSVAQFRIRCSAGTYVRSVAHELGQKLGLGAHLKSLRRTAIGSFSVDDAIKSEAIREGPVDALLSPPHFMPMGEVRLPFASVTIDPSQERRILQGQTVVIKPQVTTIQRNDFVSLSNLGDELVAIAQAVEILREGGGPIALRPKVVLKGGD